MTTSLKVTLALLVAGLTTLSATAQGRIATVDLGKVFDGYWKTKQAEAALKDRAADLEKEHKGMVEDYKKGNEEYQKLLAAANDQAVSAEEREKRKKTAETKLKEMKDLQETIAQFERQARTTLDEQRLRMRNNLLGEIRTAINSKAKSASYALVVDTVAESAKNTPVVLYNSGDNDITESLLEQLNLTAPPEPAKTDTKPADAKPAEKTDKK
jgi:outer membrane protein